MSVIAVKHLPGYGWVGVKNQDRIDKPSFYIRKSFRRGVERLYIWDLKTKYAEGVNEHGICVLSSNISLPNGDLVGKKAVEKLNKERPLLSRPRIYYSPTGLRIRKALYESTPQSVMARLIELEIPSVAFIFNKDCCFAFEGAFIATDVPGEQKYVHDSIELRPGEIQVRTNHGFLLPWTGFQATSESEEERAQRRSSDARLNQVTTELFTASTPDAMLDAVSVVNDNNPQNNALRVDARRNAYKTVGQILAIPAENLIKFRPVWCDTEYDLETLNHSAEKTFFEIVSPRKIARFKEK